MGKAGDLFDGGANVGLEETIGRDPREAILSPASMRFLNRNTAASDDLGLRLRGETAGHGCAVPGDL